jgi:hypothetical protein
MKQLRFKLCITQVVYLQSVSIKARTIHNRVLIVRIPPHRFLVGKPEGKEPLGKPRCSWVDNNRMDLGDVRWGAVDWTGLVWLGTGTGGEPS